jgi:hypothetical protein
MIKYHGDRLWVKAQLMVASILWGLIVAVAAVKVTQHLGDPLRIVLRMVLFFVGYSILEISVKQVAPEETSHE